MFFYTERTNLCKVYHCIHCRRNTFVAPSESMAMWHFCSKKCINTGLMLVRKGSFFSLTLADNNQYETPKKVSSAGRRAHSCVVIRDQNVDCLMGL